MTGGKLVRVENDVEFVPAHKLNMKSCIDVKPLI